MAAARLGLPETLTVGTLRSGSQAPLRVDGSLNIDGALSVEGGIDATNTRITNVAAPTVSTDAATKQYVDDAVAGGGGGGFVVAPINVNTVQLGPGLVLPEASTTPQLSWLSILQAQTFTAAVSGVASLHSVFKVTSVGNDGTAQMSFAGVQTVQINGGAEQVVEEGADLLVLTSINGNDNYIYTNLTTTTLQAGDTYIFRFRVACQYLHPGQPNAQPAFILGNAPTPRASWVFYGFPPA